MAPNERLSKDHAAQLGQLRANLCIPRRSLAHAVPSFSIESTPGANQMGTRNEMPLHAALRSWCARPDDRFEVSVDGYVVDIVRIPHH